MKLKRAGKDQDIKLEGIKAEMVMKDGSIARLILQDGKGNYVEIAQESYSMSVSIPAPKEKKKIWEISGSFEGIAIKEQHEQEYEALKRFNSLEGRDGIKDLKKEEIEVEVQMYLTPSPPKMKFV